MASYDVNGHDDNPMPRYDMIDSNRHGTRCAGEVAAVANNSLCSLGIAYHASVGGKAIYFQFQLILDTRADIGNEFYRNPIEVFLEKMKNPRFPGQKIHEIRIFDPSTPGVF